MPSKREKAKEQANRLYLEIRNLVNGPVVKERTVDECGRWATLASVIKGVHKSRATAKQLNMPELADLPARTINILKRRLWADALWHDFIAGANAAATRFTGACKVSNAVGQVLTGESYEILDNHPRGAGLQDDRPADLQSAETVRPGPQPPGGAAEQFPGVRADQPYEVP